MGKREGDRRLDHFIEVLDGVSQNAVRIARGACPDFKSATERVITDPDFDRLSYVIVLFCGNCKRGNGRVIISGTVGDDIQPVVTLPKVCKHNTAK